MAVLRGASHRDNYCDVHLFFHWGGSAWLCASGDLGDTFGILRDE